MTDRLRTITFLGLLLPAVAVLQADDLRERLKDENGLQTDLWVYNDIPSAMQEARRLNKPLFVTFRCVPCKDCAAFDADVANGNDRIKALAREKFVSVRQVEMKGVDLSLFQFDHDLNWAGMFINSDGVVYARYGTQSAEGSDAYNSIDGLINTMNRVLELHAAYPNNKKELEGKRGTKSQSSALEMPGLKNPAKYAQQTTRSNCIHCHNIHDAEHQQALEAGTYSPEMLGKYPLPDNIGLKIDRKSGIQVAEVHDKSAVAKAGIKVGEDIVRINGQRMTSIADMQWVFHHLPNTDTAITIECSDTGKHKIALTAGWKQNDFSWRGSMWNAPPRFQVWVPELTGDALAQLGLPKTDGALEARWINKEATSGQQAIADGLREKDVIIAAFGQPIRVNSRQFQSHLKLNYKVGDTLPLTILRDGRKINLKISLSE
ncbi:MAG: Trx7/PDZ domain-containing (seleno)protein [Planctomycetota bacterium]|nr:Trx7/PDZ domain-containing (seleno)protein [Planctomycetota bacterium]